MREEHYRRLERMYLSAPTNEHFGPEIEIADGAAEIRIAVADRFFHAAAAVHGSVYFKALDDAAFFAVNSLIDDVFVLTSSFHIHLLRPVSEGVMIARGRVVSRGTNLFVGAAELFDGQERLLATGSGSFMRSRIRLAETPGYRDAQS